ncbi:MAG: carbon storage regulator CsrA, partial [Oscillospiraceae bacterium]|nr:carbon storage regulator CsrA [Oscillospiraceae bacterium]
TMFALPSSKKFATLSQERRVMTMLVLSRKLNETIIIGDNIRVTLLGIDGDKIKLGVDAPRDVKVFREELLEATKSTNVQALGAPIVSFDLSKIKKNK